MQKKNRAAVRKHLRCWLPPALVDLLLLVGLGGNRFKYGFVSFEDASFRARGYEQLDITEAVRTASAKVRDGVAVYERDGVVFDEIEYPWPLLSSLLATPTENGVLRVLDFGGGLGSTYQQCRDFLRRTGLRVVWTVIEREQLAKVGQREFTTDELSFASDLGAIADASFDAVLFAGSICYVPNPEQVLETVMSNSPKRIIFDRTPEAKGQQPLYAVQNVGAKIYKASYPITIFGKGQIEKSLQPRYEKLASWVCDLQPDPRSTAVGALYSLRS